MSAGMVRGVGAATRTPDRAPGQVTISAEEHERLLTLDAARESAERDRLVEEAVASGRIAPTRREHWRGALDRDPRGAAAALASLLEGSAFPLEGRAPASVEEQRTLDAIRASFGLRSQDRQG